MVILLCLDLQRSVTAKGTICDVYRNTFISRYKKKYIAKPYKIRHHTIHIEGL